jgi:hypothetical protein
LRLFLLLPGGRFFTVMEVVNKECVCRFAKVMLSICIELNALCCVFLFIKSRKFWRDNIPYNLEIGKS